MELSKYQMSPDHCAANTNESDENYTETTRIGLAYFRKLVPELQSTCFSSHLEDKNPQNGL